MIKPIITGNAKLMRSINKNVVTDFIMQNEPVSRSEIAKLANLAMPTVMRIVQSLIDEGLVVEGGKGESSGGRKPTMLTINPSWCYFVGIDISKSITTILTDIRGNIIAKHKQDTLYDKGAALMLKQIKEGIKEVTSAAGVEEKDLGGIGLGIPATKFKYGEELYHSQFSSWAELDMESWIADGHFSCPIVWENISKVGALGELLFGIGEGKKDFLYIFADYGVGLGIISNGEKYVGANGVAGEFGHTTIQMQGRKCYCGNKGCIEMYASIQAMIDEVGKRLSRHDESFFDDYQADKLDFQLLLKALAGGDELAADVVREAGEILGIGIANIINLYNPGMVVIGGKLGASCPEYVEAAKQSAKKRIFAKKAQNTAIVATGVKDNCAALGAVALAIHNKFKSPTSNWQA